MSEIGLGTILRRGQGTNPIPDPSLDTFDVVGKVRNIDGLGSEKQFSDDTTLDSPGGEAEFVSGVKQPTDISLVVSLTPGTSASDTKMHQALLTDSEATTEASKRNWQVELPSGTIFDFEAEVASAVVSSITANDVVTMNVTLRRSGPIARTYPA